MGHHIDDDGCFQSDKHPELPPDRIRLSFENPLSHPALWVLAESYQDEDRELATDIRSRLLALKFDNNKDHELRKRAQARCITAALAGIEANKENYEGALAWAQVYDLVRRKL
jgi:hypothetical protein